MPLASAFLRRASGNAGRSDLAFSASDERALLAYDWPGNARELEQLIQRAVLLSPTSRLRLDLAFGSRFGGVSESAKSAIRTDTELRELERKNLQAALERANYRVAGAGGAAELLGISPSTLRDRMRSFGIEKKSPGRGAR
jgi:transcriptional regulator with GAF, ATPase, and Fis domain